MEQIKEGKENAFPHIELDTYSGKPCNQHFGLTKRELFAAMALQGMQGNTNYKWEPEAMAEDAVKYADALINELNKETR